MVKLLALVVAALSFGGAARAAEVVTIGGGWGGGRGLLLTPARKPIGSVILMAGGDGRLALSPDGRIGRLGGNALIRTRNAYVGAGFATLALDAGASPAAAVAFMRTIKGPVTVVATSRAGTRVADALSAQPDGLVLVSAMLDAFKSSAAPAALPPTLVIHHREDGCRVSSPTAVEPFAAWAAGKARIRWITGGRDEGDPCEGAGHHGMAGVEGAMIQAITAFARAPR